MMYYARGGPGFFDHGAGLGFGIIVMIGFLLLLAAGIVALVLFMKRSKHFRIHDFQSNTDNAIKILNERYARGEIAEEEYKKIKSDISS